MPTFRSKPGSGTGDVPSPRLGSIATLCLGLGVVAANAAHYDRSAGEVRGQNGYHEHAIVRIGGLSVDDLAFLLAVQATVRDDMLPALDTLRPTQAECVAAWREVLDDHEVELKRLLGIADDGAFEPLTRPDEPRLSSRTARSTSAISRRGTSESRCFAIARPAASGTQFSVWSVA